MLSSFNLSEYVINPFTENSEFDFDSFRKDIPQVVEFMDDLLEEGIKYLPLEEQVESAKKYRQLGIGTMGMADMFIKMGIKYGSPESLKLIDDIFFTLSDGAILKSSLLAKDKGSYLAYDKTKVLKSSYLKQAVTPSTYESISKYGLRNAELLSIAPTGSLSSMWNVSGGVEPIFATHYIRKSESLGEDGEPVYYNVYTGIVEEYMELNNIVDTQDLPEYFITANELGYKDRINVQSVIQKYVDSAISSTINLPEHTTIEEVESIFMYAWEKGLKGVTIYRDGCARGGILTTNKDSSKNKIQQIDELQEQIDKLVVESLEENPDTCPMCGGQLIHTNHCETCVDCGYSPCSI
jgi:ribonucleoside-diphosphate reductase alpha chain